MSGDYLAFGLKQKIKGAAKLFQAFIISLTFTDYQVGLFQTGDEFLRALFENCPRGLTAGRNNSGHFFQT